MPNQTLQAQATEQIKAEPYERTKERQAYPLREHSYPFVIVDAKVIRVREDGRVCQRGLLIAFSVNEEGYREVSGLMVGDSESEESWSEFFSWLKQRGLHGVDIIVSDQSQRAYTGYSSVFSGFDLAALLNPFFYA
jgi:transposase-like protein